VRPHKHKKRVEQLKKEGKWVQKNRQSREAKAQVEEIRKTIEKVLNRYIGLRATENVEAQIKAEVNDILDSAWLKGIIAPSTVLSVNFDQFTGRCNVNIDAKIEPQVTEEINESYWQTRLNHR
jgi:uncharacterized protein YhaN